MSNGSYGVRTLKYLPPVKDVIPQTPLYHIALYIFSNSVHFGRVPMSVSLLPFHCHCPRKLIGILIRCFCTGDVNAAMTFDSWSNAGFVCCFLGSAVMGFVLNYSVVLCTAYNSALTTTIIGNYCEPWLISASLCSS